MTDSDVTYERLGSMALIRLNRAQALNALTYSMINSIQKYSVQAEADPEVVAICITGTGRGFCAGIDMSVLTSSTGDGAPTPVELEGSHPRNPALFNFLIDISKPVIAAINGVAAGGGFVLAMMCDLRFMAEDTSLTTVFARRGLIAEHGTSWLLPRMIGLSRALDILWSSRKVNAEEAYRLGLADRVVPAGDLLASVQAYTDELSRHVAPRALAAIKAQVHRHLSMTFDEAAIESEALMIEALKHPDAIEGAASFIERRAPNFSTWKGESE